MRSSHMPTLVLHSEFSNVDVAKQYLIKQSRETIRNLTKLAESTRQTTHKAQSTSVNFLDTFFKPAKQHIL